MHIHVPLELFAGLQFLKTLNPVASKVQALKLCQRSKVLDELYLIVGQMELLQQWQ